MNYLCIQVPDCVPGLTSWGITAEEGALHKAALRCGGLMMGGSDKDRYLLLIILCPFLFWLASNYLNIEYIILLKKKKPNLLSKNVFLLAKSHS